jgi:hypothetical protein
MTAEAVVLNKTAVALAADSKATLRINGVPKSHDTANKLFTLSKIHPVGVMINGNAEFMQFPWETLIKIYRDRLRHRCCKTLEEYGKDFLLSLTSDYGHSELEQANNVRYIVAEKFNNIARKSQNASDKGDKREIEAIARDVLREARAALAKLPVLASMGDISTEAIRERYAEVIGSSLDDVTEDVPAELREEFISYACEVLLKPSFSQGRSGVVVAGFGQDEVFPSLNSWTVDGVVADRVRCHSGVAQKISKDDAAGIYPFAQREMVDRFMLGIDPDYKKYMNESFSTILRTVAADIIDQYGRGRKSAKAAAMKSIEEALASALANHNKLTGDYAFEKYASPILNLTAALPKDELAHLAESLVNLTSFKRRVSLDTESVGGAIDVAVISKSDGFMWIKRKHYFDIARNRSFIKNYARSQDTEEGSFAHERS